MSDFDAAVDLMFNRAQSQTQQIIETWLMKMGDFLVIQTPGPGNQRPADTEYIAKGVLRMGYNWSSSAPPSMATVKDNDGDDSYDADSVRAKLGGQLGSLELRGDLWLTTDVLYADIVHEGRGRHKPVGPRPFTTQTAIQQVALFNEATAEVLR